MARVVVQRVRSASVSVDGETVGRIERGFAVLLGIRQGDEHERVIRLADKVASLRLFEDEQGKMNLGLAEVKGQILLVSQFTLFGDVRKGRRPSFITAAGPQDGERLYRRFGERLADLGYPPQLGRFGAHMVVALENDGPVTLIIDSDEL